MDTCSSTHANYLQVFFECSPIAEGLISFMARNNVETSLSTNDVVPWDVVITSFGSHYNPKTYSFVCPVHGVYAFSATVVTCSHYIRAEICLNGGVVVFIRADNSDDDYDMASSSVVIECQAGDVVWVNVGSGGSFSGDYFDDVFSGFLLDKL